MNDSADRTLRNRVAENPRPAMIWAAGLAVLVLLELGRFAHATLNAGAILKFILESFATIPPAIGDNVAGQVSSVAGDQIGDVAGLVALSITALLLLAAVAGPIRSRLPKSPAVVLDLDTSPNARLVIDRLVVTLGLGVVVLLVVATPLGAAVDALVGAIASGIDAVTGLPTITDRELISNQGHRTPGGGWSGTFLGLSPAVAWGIRVAVVYGYAAILFYWLWRGYLTFREHYRQADWTPFDDSIDRMRGHRWGQFGFVVVFMFVVLALWAPALGPVTAEENLYEPYQNDVEYLGENGEVQTTTHGAANIQSRSDGTSNIGPLSYDQYNRWAPFGTNGDGKDLFTFLAYGARTSLVIGLLAISLSGTFALGLSMLSSYYKGIVDLIAVLASDTVQSIPAFLLILLLMVVFRESNHPLMDVYDGGVLLALILAFAYWPGLWRSIRGPALQISEAEWIDAAKSFGQRPTVTMRKHMAPYIVVYMLIYASLILGGIIITTAALSFLGLGINPPTPEWGRMISDGRGLVSTRSWHVATIPGLLIVLVVTGFNALGDAIRDALDVETDIGDSAGETSGGGV